mmetsp:Transcript_31600/g.80982  ORF Transcript_31600/g.80982 Transcript_31600/m.80982 type:complete len:287 (+) Transcript_31600:82-942(+)
MLRAVALRGATLGWRGPQRWGAAWAQQLADSGGSALTGQQNTGSHRTRVDMWSCGHERWISASGGDSREGREQEAPPSSAGGDGVKRGEASGTAEQGRGAGADGAPPGGGGGDAEDKAAQEANAQQAIQAMALLRRTRRALGGSLLAQVFRPVAKLAVDYMMRTTLTSLDPEHDSEEFLEAVGDAYCMVNHLLSGQDLEALRPMMTAQLHQSFTEVRCLPAFAMHSHLRCVCIHQPTYTRTPCLPSASPRCQLVVQSPSSLYHKHGTDGAELCVPHADGIALMCCM